MTDSDNSLPASATSSGNYDLSLRLQADSGSVFGGMEGGGEGGGSGNLMQYYNTTPMGNAAYNHFSGDGSKRDSCGDDPEAFYRAASTTNTIYTPATTQSAEGLAEELEDWEVLLRSIDALMLAIFVFARDQGFLEDAVEPGMFRFTYAHAVNNVGSNADVHGGYHALSRSQPAADERDSDADAINDAFSDADAYDGYPAPSLPNFATSTQISPGQSFRQLASQIVQEVRQNTEYSGDERSLGSTDMDISSGSEPDHEPSSYDGNDADNESSSGDEDDSEDEDDDRNEDGKESSDEDKEGKHDSGNGDETHSDSDFASDSELSDLGATPPPPTAELQRIEHEHELRRAGYCRCTGWCTCPRYSSFYDEPLPTAPGQTHLSERVLAAEVHPVSGIRSTLRGHQSDPSPQAPSWERLPKPYRAPHGVEEDDWVTIDE